MKRIIISVFLCLSFGTSFGQSLQTHTESFESLCFEANPPDTQLSFSDHDPKGLWKYPRYIRELIRSGQIRIGFNRNQTESSWGKPDYIINFKKYSQDLNKCEKRELKKFEFWFYGETMLIFSRGKLINFI